MPSAYVIVSVESFTVGTTIHFPEWTVRMLALKNAGYLREVADTPPVDEADLVVEPVETPDKPVASKTRARKE